MFLFVFPLAQSISLLGGFPFCCTFPFHFLFCSADHQDGGTRMMNVSIPNYLGVTTGNYLVTTSYRTVVDYFFLLKMSQKLLQSADTPSTHLK